MDYSRKVSKSLVSFLRRSRDTEGRARAWVLARRRVPQNPHRVLGEAQKRSVDRAFSLIEMMVTVAILLVVTGAVFSLIASYEETHQRTELKADMYSGIRATAEVIAQEVGQAGVVSLPASNLTAAVTPSATAQAVGVSSTTSMFVGEKLLIDAGPSEELVTVTALNASQITAIFSNSHLSGAAINALGVFWQGVMSSSTATQLQLFGDINADGSLVYVHYDCNTAAGTLTRSITTVTPSVTASNAGQVLLSNLIANPGGTACFQYTSTPAGSATYTFVTNVAVTLSVQTSEPDPQTGAYLTLTKSFLDLRPRNVLAGVELAPPLLTASVTGSGTAQTVSVTWAGNISVGQQLTVDSGSSQESVTVTAVNAGANQVTGVFTKSHTSGTVIGPAPNPSRLQPAPPNLPLS